MRRFTLQIILLLLLASFCVAGYLSVRHILGLPFRAANDALHQRGSAFTLDFLIPAGTYLDETITIGEVITIRFQKEGSFYEKLLRAFSDLIPPRYRLVADLILFSFWFLCFMTLLRVFTFMGYGRALRSSLLLGGMTYYFMPDFSPGKRDDLLFVVFALLIIALRAYLRWRKDRRKEVIIESS